MAEANSASVGSGCEEKGPDGSPAESVPHSTTISRLKLLDTTVDTFLQKLIAAGRACCLLALCPPFIHFFRHKYLSAIYNVPGCVRGAGAITVIKTGSYQRFTDCYKRFHQLQPEMTQRIYDKFMTQLQTSVREEISDIKAEGNLEAVLNALDTIAEEGKDRKELAWRPSGKPEEDLRSTLMPYFLQQRDALQRCVRKQEAENRQLADAVLAGRRQVEELQLQGQAQWQAWQALHRGQKELVAVLRESE